MSDLDTWLMGRCELLRPLGTSLDSGQVLVCDLTTGTDAREKREHRRDLSQWLGHGGSAVVRINHITTPFCSEDVEEVLGLPGLQALLIPDVRVPAALRGLARRIARAEIPLLAELTSAEAIDRLSDIADVPGIDGLVFDPLSFALDVGAACSARVLAYPRSVVAIASRSRGLQAPVEYAAPFSVGDPTEFGFAARIHPMRDAYRRAEVATSPESGVVRVKDPSETDETEMEPDPVLRTRLMFPQ